MAPQRNKRWVADHTEVLHRAAMENLDELGYADFALIKYRIVFCGDYEELRERLPRNPLLRTKSKVLQKKFQKMGGMLRPLWLRATGRQEYAAMRARR